MDLIIWISEEVEVPQNLRTGVSKVIEPQKYPPIGACIFSVLLSLIMVAVLQLNQL